MLRQLMTAVFLACFVLPSQAQATDVDPLVAEYEKGKAALEAGNAVEALTTFKAALNSADVSRPESWQLLLAVAVAYKDLERAVESVEYFRRFLSITDPFRDAMSEKWRVRRERVSQELRLYERSLARTHAFLRVDSDPPGVELVVDGMRAGADRNAVTPFTVIVPAGTHVITGQLAGLPPITKKVTVLAGQYDALRFQFEVAPEAPPEAPSQGDAADEQAAGDIAASGALASAAYAHHDGDGPGQPAGAWALVAVGVAAAAGGGVMTYLASDAHDTLSRLSTSTDPGSAVGEAASQRWSDAKQDVATYEPVSYALYGVGAAAILGGIIWMAVDAPESTAHSVPRVGITPSARGAFAHATWRFE